MVSCVFVHRLFTRSLTLSLFSCLSHMGGGLSNNKSTEQEIIIKEKTTQWLHLVYSLCSESVLSGTLRNFSLLKKLRN